VLSAIAFFILALLVWPSTSRPEFHENTVQYAAVLYGPCVAFWLVFDLWRASITRAREEAEKESNKREREEGERKEELRRRHERAAEYAALKHPTAEPKRETPAQRTKTPAPDDRCKSCGAAAPPDAEFCDACGAGLAPMCSKCGTKNRDAAQFCKKCGTSLPGRERPSLAIDVVVEVGEDGVVAAKLTPPVQDEPMAWGCPGCGATNAQRRTECRSCSVPRPPPTMPAAPQEAAAAPSGPLSWECPKCGATNAQRRTRCRQCDAWNPN
jgi:ribosomal protein L40E